MNDAGGNINQALDALAALKAEHGPLISQIAGDPGMAPQLRRALIDHIYEEEDEKMRTISALRGAGGPASSPDLPPQTGLTVGSLRPATPQSLQLGSLRARAATTSVGSLRR